MASVSTLIDDFTTLDGTKWTNQTGVTVSGGQLRINNTPSYPTLHSVSSYDLTSSSCYVQLVTIPTTTGTDAYFELSADGTHRYTWNFSGTTISAYYADGGSAVQVGTSLAYSSTNHKFFRIRHSGSTIFWDTSPDGTTWTNRFSTAQRTFAITAVSVVIDAGNWNGTTTDTVVFDNLNTTGSTAETITVANASLTLTGQTVVPTDLEVVGKASLTLTGQTVNVGDTEPITVTNAALALTAQTVTPTDLEVVSKASLSLTGQTVTPTDLEGVSPSSLTLTGQTVGVVDSEGVAPASLTLTGQGVLETETAPVAPASLTLTGQDVATPADTAPGTETITVDTGLLGLTGQGLTVSDIVILDPSARTATGGGGAGEGKRKLDLERRAAREARQRLLDDAVEQSYPGVKKPAPAAPQPVLDDDEDDEELLLLIG